MFDSVQNDKYLLKGVDCESVEYRTLYYANVYENFVHRNYYMFGFIQAKNTEQNRYEEPCSPLSIF